MAEESKSRKTTSSTRKNTASKSTSAARKPATRAPAKKAGTSKAANAKSTPKRTTTKAAATTPAKKAGTSKAANAKSTKKANAKGTRAKTAAATKKGAAKAAASSAPDKAPSRPPVNLAPLAAAASANPGNEEETPGSPGNDETTAGNAENGDESSGPTQSLHHGEGWETIDISDTVAPSIGPHTTFDMPVHKGPRGHDESHSLDAMGLDKRRAVVGGRYSPPLSKQLTIYGVALAVIAALVVGAILLVGELDKPPEDYPAKAPWSNSDKPPAQLQ